MGKSQRLSLRAKKEKKTATDLGNYGIGVGDTGVVLLKCTKIGDEDEKTAAMSMNNLHDSALSLGSPSSSSENESQIDTCSSNSSSRSTSGSTTPTKVSLISASPSLSFDSGYQSEVLTGTMSALQKGQEEMKDGLGQPKRCYGNTRIFQLEPVSVIAERINQRIYEACFTFEIPANCLKGIKNAALKLILDAKVNHNFNTPYFLTTKYQTMYTPTSAAALEEEPGFRPASSHSHQCLADSPTKILFAMTSTLENIANKINSSMKDKGKGNGTGKRHKKMKIECLRLELTLRRRNKINPASIVESCDHLTHLFQPAHLTVEWDPFQRT